MFTYKCHTYQSLNQANYNFHCPDQKPANLFFSPQPIIDLPMKTKKINNIFFPVFLIFGFIMMLINPVGLHAQTIKHSEEITIVGAFEPKISDAFKINLNPTVKDEELSLPVLSYYMNPMQLSTWFDLSPIKPAAVRGDRLSTLYRNFLKAGYGNFSTPFLEFSANNLRSDEYAFGVHLKHHSSAGKIKYYANSAYSDNLAEVFGKKFYKDHTLSGRLVYNHQINHHYGYDPILFATDPLTDDQIKQRYQLAGANFLYNSNFIETGKVNHSFGLNYYYLTDINKTSEHNLNFTSRFDNTFKFSNITEEQKLGLVVNADYYNYADTLNSGNKLLIAIKPYLQTDLEQYRFYAGINAMAEIDTASTFHFYPEVKAGVEIVPNAFIASVGITGGFTQNSFNYLRNINPYINSVLPQTYQNNKFEVYGQIRGKIIQGFDFDVILSNSSIDNMPFFVNDSSTKYRNTFEVIFDDVNLLNARLTFSFQSKESIKILFKANYYDYTMTNELRPWHKPEYDISLTARFTIRDIIFIRGEIINYGKSFAKDYTPSGFSAVSAPLDSWIEVNLGIEYRYNKNLSVFADFNNLGNTSYMKWYNYPVQNFSILGGLSYSF